EVFWVIGLKYSDSLLEWTGTIIEIILSFYFIIKACEKLPAGTVYAVFSGSGAAAIAFIDFTVFAADFAYSKALLIGLIIFGVIGIKMTTPPTEEDKKQEDTRQGGH